VASSLCAGLCEVANGFLKLESRHLFWLLMIICIFAKLALLQRATALCCAFDDASLGKAPSCSLEIVDRHGIGLCLLAQ
jgi:hypothetical protein